MLGDDAEEDGYLPKPDHSLEALDVAGLDPGRDPKEPISYPFSFECKLVVRI